MKIYLFCLFLLSSLACNQPAQNSGATGTNGDKNIEEPGQTVAFNQSFAKVLNAYLALKDQLVAEQDSGIAQATRALIIASDSLKLSELKADSSLIQTAFSYSDGISSEAQGLLGENNLVSKRRSFQMISDQFYDLIRTVHYKEQTLYRFYCDKAFEDQGAFWISTQQSISNPYLPKSNAPCGEIRDTIPLSAK